MIWCEPTTKTHLIKTSPLSAILRLRNFQTLILTTFNAQKWWKMYWITFHVEQAYRSQLPPWIPSILICFYDNGHDAYTWCAMRFFIGFDNERKSQRFRAELHRLSQLQFIDRSSWCCRNFNLWKLTKPIWSSVLYVWQCLRIHFEAKISIRTEIADALLYSVRAWVRWSMVYATHS